ncbi:hypothetical protein DSO57_1032741 [Entomophthora muscae]|uniref:Uncharacterized protein n=1 Tax=Entomophthora muscae TaxID=34485 RepID=A0ACC2SCX6_9FUNG|nr:hypothetical protein DSO57_1032741 [Entomophthora muscae]
MKFIACVAGVLAVNERRLVKTSENAAAQWVTEQDILTMLQSHTHFMDITETGDAPKLRAFRSGPRFPSETRYADKVRPLLEQISNNRMLAFLTEYSSFYNRYYSSQTGVAASKWLKEQIQNSTFGMKIQIEAVSHSFPQQSIIARFPGSDPALANEIVIIGGHLDSINMYDPLEGMAPGADDDGTGTTANLETFRILAASGFSPKRTVEFHWYAGEEKGLLGSQDIAKSYFKAKKNVVSMVQFDMVGYLTHNRQVAFVIDYTNPALTDFLRKVADKYLNITHTEYTCGYGCSDHASWTKYGFPSAFPFEDEINPNIHTAQDTLDFVNFDNVKEFVKLAIAYLVEIAEPST